jgi:hypothetical protein
MLFASSRDALKRCLVGIAVEIQGTDLSEVAHDTGWFYHRHQHFANHSIPLTPFSSRQIVPWRLTDQMIPSHLSSPMYQFPCNSAWIAEYLNSDCLAVGVCVYVSKNLGE